MSTNDRTLLAAYLAGNIVEAHKAAPPADAQQPDALQQWHETVSEDERTRSNWALFVIAASAVRDRQQSATCAGNTQDAEKCRSQADYLDKRASEWLATAIAQGAFDAWPIPVSV